VFYAARYQVVVRLKGGDPYVFGRGHEELEYAVNRGVNVELIPGISSALAAPASCGIPLTKRGVNESFWVVTGTLSSGELSNDIRLAAQSSATVIILMGISKLKEVLSLFIQARSAYEPVAIIEHATLPSQRVISGAASGILSQLESQGINMPAVIVIER
jgi:uroporphyrin-III C-methyltransferase